MSSKRTSIVDALDDSASKHDGGFHSRRADTNNDLVASARSTTFRKVSRGAATSLGNTAIDDHRLNQMPELSCASSKRAKSSHPGKLDPLVTPKRGTYQPYLSTFPNATGGSHGLRCVNAAKDAIEAATTKKPPVKHHSLLKTSGRAKGRVNAAVKESLPLYEPPPKRRAGRPVGVSANNPVCVDDSSGDEEKRPQADGIDIGAPAKPPASDFFPAPDKLPEVSVASAPPPTTTASSSSNSSSSLFRPTQHQLLTAERVCVGTLPGCVVGQVAVEGELKELLVKFRMTVNDNDTAVSVPLKNITQWEYGSVVEPQNHMLRLKLTPRGASHMRVRFPATFNKEVLNPELRLDCKAYVTFFLVSPLSESERLHLEDLVEKCNASLSEQTWINMSEEDVGHFASELCGEASAALKAISEAAPFTLTSKDFYADSATRRSTRTSTRINTLQAQLDYGDYSSSSKSSSSAMSTLPDDYIKPVPEANPKELVTYPPRPQPGGITVTSNDLLCLQPQEFLNDIIIDFYLKYLFHTLAEDMQGSIHMFNSFFYHRLTQRQGGSSRPMAKNGGGLAAASNPHEEMHGRVKKWTRNVDIFDKDLVFIPINEHAHWYLAVVCFPGADGPVVDSDADANGRAGKKFPATAGTTGTSGGGGTQHAPLRLGRGACASGKDGAGGVEPPISIVVSDTLLCKNDSLLGAEASPSGSAVQSGEDEQMDCAGSSPLSFGEQSPRDASTTDVPMSDGDDDDDNGDSDAEEVLIDDGEEEGERCDRKRQQADRPSPVVVEDSLEDMTESSSRATGCSSAVSLQDAVEICSRGGDDQTSPPSVTVNKALGRSIAVGTDRKRDMLDDVLFSGSAGAAAGGDDAAGLENWPFTSRGGQAAGADSVATSSGKGKGTKRKARKCLLNASRPRIRRPSGPPLKSQPCILIFDSLGSRYRSRVVNNLRSYLSEEWQAKRGTQRSFGSDVMKAGYPKVPEQDNFCDCGVFVLQYAESMLQNPIKNFQIPIRIMDWFSQETVSRKRRAIIDLINKLKVKEESTS